MVDLTVEMMVASKVAMKSDLTALKMVHRTVPKMVDLTYNMMVA